MKSSRLLVFAAAFTLIVGLLPAGAGAVRAATPTLVDPDPNDYTIVIESPYESDGPITGAMPDLDPLHNVVTCGIEPEHAVYCTLYGYPYPPKYGTPYGYPPKYGTPYGYPPKYGTPYGYPPQYGTPYGYPPQYGTPYGVQYGYPSPPTLPDSSVSCTSTPSGAGVVTGSGLSCTAVNQFFIDGNWTTDATVSVTGGATLNGSATASSGTLSFNVNLNSTGSACIVISYAADSGGNNAHKAATHYLDTINGSTSVNGSPIVTTTGCFTIVGPSVSISGLTPMSVWLASDTLGEDTITVSSTSGQSVALTLSGCSTSSSSDVLSATVASGGTLVVYGRTAGTCTISATSPASASANTTVSKRAQTITFATPANRLMTDASTFTIAPTASSGLAVTTTSSTTGVCTIAGNTVTVVAAGTCTLTAVQAGNATYSAAPDDIESFTISKASQALNGATLSRTPASGSIAPGDSLVVSYGATIYGAESWSVSGPCTKGATQATAIGASTAITVSGAGSCTISLSAVGSAIYAGATSATLTIVTTDGSQEISFSALATGKKVNETFTLSATSYQSGTSTPTGLTVSFASTTPTICSLSGSTVTALKAGTCTISASQAGGSSGGISYGAAATVTRSTTIEKADQIAPTLSVAAGPYLAGDTKSVTLSGGSKKGSMSWSYSGGCTMSNTTLTSATLNLNTPGLCTIGANYAGDADWNSVSVETQITIGGSTQTISFSQPSSPVNTATSASLSASSLDSDTNAATGLSVSFSSSTPSVCTVSGSTVSYVGVGSCALTASQAGGTGSGGRVYGAATSVTRYVSVEGALQTLNFSYSKSVAEIEAGLTLGEIVDLTVTTSSGLPVSMELPAPLTSCTVTALDADTWRVRSTGMWGGCNLNFLSDEGTVDGVTYLQVSGAAGFYTEFVPEPTVGAVSGSMSFSAGSTSGAASKVQLTSPTVFSDGNYQSADGTVTIKLGCGSSPARYLDAIEITRTQYIDGANQGSSSETISCADLATYAPTLSPARYVFTARAVKYNDAADAYSPSVTIASVVVSSEVTIAIAPISGSTTDAMLLTGAGLRYLRTTTPTLSWAVTSGAMSGQTLKRYTASVAESGACPSGTGGSAASPTQGSGWTLSSTLILEAGERSKSFSGVPLSENCVQFAHIATNGGFSTTTWSAVYLVDTTPPSLAASLSGRYGGSFKVCSVVTTQNCIIEPGDATISVISDDRSTSVANGYGSGSSTIRIYTGSTTSSSCSRYCTYTETGFDTGTRSYATAANQSRLFTVPSSNTSFTVYATIFDRAGNSSRGTFTFSVARETQPVFNAVVDLVDCAAPSKLIREDFAEEGFIYWPVGTELCLVPRVDMAQSGLRTYNGVSQRTFLVGTLSSKLTGGASSANDLSKVRIGKWPTDRVNTRIPFINASLPTTLSEAQNLANQRSSFLYAKMRDDTATTTEKNTFAANVLRFKINAETSPDDADSAAYVSIPLEFEYVWGWVTAGTTGPLSAYKSEKVSITLKVVAVNLGARE